MQRAYIGLWQQCDVNTAQAGAAAGKTCQSSKSSQVYAPKHFPHVASFAVQPPSVNNDNTAYTNSQQSYTSILGARAGAIIGLVITLAMILISAYCYWKFDSAKPHLARITLIILGLAFGQFLCSCITVGCFNTAISNENGYLSAGRHWSAGTGLSLSIVGLVGSIAALGLAAIAALDARGYPPSKWSAALREKVSRGGAAAQDSGDTYSQLHGDVEAGGEGGHDPLHTMPQRSSVERGGALPHL